MKKIEALIEPSKFDEVSEALEEIGLDEITVSEVKAYGRQKAHMEIYRGTRFPVGFASEIKIELTLRDNQLDAAVAAITKGSKSARIHGGKVFISHVEDSVSIHAEEAELHPV